jgi:hypothetical protein
MTANLQPGLTVKQAAELMSVSERSVYMARAVQRLRPDLSQKINAGEMSLAAAHREATGKAKATSWDRLISAWNNAGDDERQHLLSKVLQ